MSRVKVAVIFGGASEEHLISIKSAQEVAAHLDPGTYEPIYIGITRGGQWLLCEAPSLGWQTGDCRPAIVSPDPGVHGLLVETAGTYAPMRVDVVLPVLHGTLGEDGAIQGLLELSGIPYVGCDIQGSALCMDKSLTYLVAASAGVATPGFWTVHAGEEADSREFTYPVFVKPARSGSSFGVTRVERSEDLADAVELARQFDSKVLVEAAVTGSEVGCALLETDTELLVGEVDQIRLSHGFFRIHQENEPEVRSENSTIVVPAEISPEARMLVQQTARVIYRALGCRGLARVDMFLTGGGAVVLNEVNTFPGMTRYSRYPRMMAAAGRTLGDVLDRLLWFAINGRRR